MHVCIFVCRVLSASVAKPQSFEKDSDSSGEELTEEAKGIE